MLGTLERCKPAPVLARGVLRLRRCLRPNAFGNALGDSLAAANGQSSYSSPGSDPSMFAADYRNGSDIESDNAALQRQTQPYYDQIVGAFGQPGGNAYAGAQLAAGPGYGGMGAGSDRDQNIARMLDLANRPESGGAWTGMGVDGVPRVSFGVFGPGESAHSDSGLGFIDEVRSATAGSVNQGSAIGTPLAPSQAQWVSAGYLAPGQWTGGVDTGDDSARLLARAKDSPAMQQWAKDYYSYSASTVNAAERADGFADNTSRSIRSDATLLDLGRRLTQDIPFLADVKNESAAPLRGYVNDMFALSNDPKASFLTRWAAQQSAASGINTLSEFEAGFPTNTLGVAGTLLGGGAIARGISADINTAKAFGSLTEGELGALRYAGLTDAEIASHMAVNGDVYLFRGTSPGYAGSPGAQATAVSAAVDPYSATIFALEARAQGGSGVVQYGTRSQMGTFAEGNFPPAGAVREREISLPMSATEFAQKAPNAIPVDAARQALKEMGLPNLPYSVRGASQRAELLELAPRMTPEQVAEFLRRVGP